MSLMRPPVEIIEGETEIHGQSSPRAERPGFGLKMTSKLIQRIFEAVGVEEKKRKREKKAVSQPIAAAQVNAFLLLCNSSQLDPTSGSIQPECCGRNRLGKFPATVIQTRVVRRKNTVPYSAAVPLPHEVNVCISIILRSDECREPTTLTATLPFSLLASKAPTVFFRRCLLR
ncbi:hypothetical protein ALC53_09624 [Atta colombica]|uniref:Uncharacterized protein n=1 Tax=Atta colombica TaxID=520822 RepID=A0A151I162_9HYME|nr:hypothetical protein ALC53_09624 [Atta colombica]